MLISHHIIIGSLCYQQLYETYWIAGEQRLRAAPWAEPDLLKPAVRVTPSLLCHSQTSSHSTLQPYPLLPLPLSLPRLLAAISSPFMRTMPWGYGITMVTGHWSYPGGAVRGVYLFANHNAPQNQVRCRFSYIVLRFPYTDINHNTRTFDFIGGLKRKINNWVGVLDVWLPSNFIFSIK